MPGETVTVELVGADDVLARMKALAAVGDAVPLLTDALLEAGTPMLDMAQRNAPEAEIARAITLKPIASKREDKASVRLRVLGPRTQVARTGKKKTILKAALWEFGTRMRVRLSGGITGIFSPKPFMRPSIDANEDRAQEIFAARIRAKLEAIANG